MKTTKIEEWRIANGMTLEEMGKIMGTSRSYAHGVCQNGVVRIGNLLRLLAVTRGELRLEDLLSDSERIKLEDDGFLELDRLVYGQDMLGGTAKWVKELAEEDEEEGEDDVDFLSI